ncbi:MAG TPA: DNA-binding response regulator [Ruminococcaceae bacterium]|nr:DNA-binding response regulator [Oscillospiraceae bacterium]
MKILVVDDEKLLVKGIKFNLENDGYEVVTGCDGMEAVELAASESPDLIVLDLMMPRLDGLEACTKIREFSQVPIIMLTAKSEDMDKLLGFEHGADDYLTKPFLTQELLLRIQRILQRCYRGELWRTAAKTLQLGQRTVYLADALVRLPDGTAQPLTATERALLQKLAENRGHIVTYDAVCEAVRGADYYGYENSLNVHIRHLREKLEPNPSKPQYLLTVRGIGYKLAEENAQ